MIRLSSFLRRRFLQCLSLYLLCSSGSVRHYNCWVSAVPSVNEDAASFLANVADLAMFRDYWNRLGSSPTSLVAANGTSLPALSHTILAVTDGGWDAWAIANPMTAPLYTMTSNNNGTMSSTSILWREHLRQLLQWHVLVDGAFTVAQLLDGTRSSVATLTGNEYLLPLDATAQTIGGIPSTAIVDPDNSIPSTDEASSVVTVIHILDQVLVPPYLAVNLMDRLLMNDNDEEEDAGIIFAYTTMANLALLAGLDQELNDFLEEGTDGWTLLVPPNRRFNRAQIDVVPLLTDEEGARRFVQAHMIPSYYDVARITSEIAERTADDPNVSEMLVSTALGTSLWFSTKDDRLRIQSTEVLKSNQLAQNAIFHVLDLPLQPPYISDIAEFTSLSTSLDTSDCFRFFTQALLSSQDISTLANTTLTMFCPTREAFAAFDQNTFSRLLEPVWKRHSVEFLFNMLTGPASTSEELLAQSPSSITMLNGMTYELIQSGGSLLLSNGGSEQSRIQFADLVGLDGYLHITDTVLTPTAVQNSVYDHARAREDFSLLVTNIDFVQLTDFVDRDLPITWLAPDDAAFGRITFGTLDGGEILKRHLFTGLLYCDVIANQTELVAVNGEVLDVELRGDPDSGLWGPSGQNLYVGGALIYECDVLAWNGIFHAIDRVIGADYETIPPSISPVPTVTPQPTSNSSSTGPTISPPIKIEQTLNQTLFGITNFTNEDIADWETVATMHVNEYLVDRLGPNSTLTMEAELEVIAYSTTQAVAEEESQRRVLEPQETTPFVTIEYNHTLLVRQESDSTTNFLLGTDITRIDDLFLEPFNDPENKLIFEALLEDQGVFLGNVTSISDVVIAGVEPEPTPPPTRAPTLPTAVPTTAKPTVAPKKSTGYSPSSQTTGTIVVLVLLSLLCMSI